MYWLKQRFNDWWLERRIKSLGEAACQARRLGDVDRARTHCWEMIEAIKQRSPEQQRRMAERVAQRIIQRW